MEPEAWFGSPLLSGLDGRGRADVTSAGSVHRLASGARVFQSGDAGDTLWFVGSGAIALASARGARRLGPREHFGTEALVPGALRVTSATADVESSLLELPVTVLRRVLARTGAEGPFVRVEAAARRQAFALLVAESPLGRACDEAALAAFASELREERRAAGEVLFVAGERAGAAYFVVSGLVGLRSGGAELHAARGDWLALDTAFAGAAQAETATALGAVLVLAASREALRVLVAGSPAALVEQRSVSDARRAKQRRVRELVGAPPTESAFSELARLESARSLLVIDAERCVRCGHCVEACAGAHGTPRLERRGERVRLTLVGGDFDRRAHPLVLARSCQHCREPACLVECPTGAIVRNGGGTVLVREEACTGCGACAKACPWDAVRMAPRAAAPLGSSALVAHKCDRCHGQSGPECVAACPTGALARLEPVRDVLELTGVRAEQKRRAESPSATVKQEMSLVRAVLALAALPPLVAWLRFGAEIPHAATATGAVAAFACALLGLYPLAKRVRPLRARLVRATSALGGRGIAPWRGLHEFLGLLACLLVLVHAGARLPAGGAGALALGFWLLAASGVGLAAVYRSLPSRLARLERHGSLPEDRATEFAELEQRLFRTLTGGDRAQKELVRRLLAPYAFGAGGPLALVVSGRTLVEERAALGARLEHVFAGRRSERLGDVRELVETAVALRALRARGLLERALSLWLPLHVALSLFFSVLLVVHVVAVLG
jgi:Fe-S-cluster-containing dehydrogenase component/CRP-like cAMP-binding protein